MVRRCSMMIKRYHQLIFNSCSSHWPSYGGVSRWTCQQYGCYGGRGWRHALQCRVYMAKVWLILPPRVDIVYRYALSSISPTEDKNDYGSNMRASCHVICVKHRRIIEDGDHRPVPARNVSIHAGLFSCVRPHI